MKPTPFPHTDSSRRRGFSLTEILVATILLAVMLTSIVPVARWVSRTSQGSTDRRAAQREIANLMEHIAALPHEKRTQEQINSLAIRIQNDSGLDDAELTATVTAANDADAVRVNLRLAWTDHTGKQMKPARLTGWFYPEKGQADGPAS